MVSESGASLLQNAQLRNQLASLIKSRQILPQKVLSLADVIVTPCEINQRHEIGAFINKLFSASSNIFSIRSTNSYDEEHELGDVSICLSHEGRSRPEVFQNVLKGFNGSTARRILCFPLHASDALSALAAKELFDIPLCTYFLHGQNIVGNNIPDNIIRELLQKSSLRLTISPEARNAYEGYGLKFWLLPQNAAILSTQLAVDGIAEWIWQSLDRGEPCDLRFEKLMPRLPSEMVYFLEPPVPKDLWGDFILVYQAMRRLQHQGFHPDFVVDVGASMGIWSHTVHKFFPDARFILIEPLISQYDGDHKKYYMDTHPNFEILQVAVSNCPGKASFQVSPDLFGSSLLQPADFRTYNTVEVEVTTLDRLAAEKAILGRGILKIDVQCAEHLVLEGASKFLEQVDVIAVELSLVRYDDRSKVFAEMLQMIDELGFRYYDDTGGWRSPVDGTLLQKDVLFIRKNLLLPELG